MSVEFSSKSVENPSTDPSMSSTAAEMQAIVREAAEPVLPGEHIKAAICRAARRLHLGFRRAKAHWYLEAKLIPADEADRLRAARQALRSERLARLDAEAAVLRARLEERRQP